MSGRMDALAHAFDGSLWAILPEKLSEIVAFLEFRAQGGKLDADALAMFAATGAKREPSRAGQDGRVAVLPIYGTIAQRISAMRAMSGGTSTEALARQFSEAVNDPSVSAIVFDVDSPGGAVEGVEELSALIASARGEKPMTAVVNSLMASAAYWIGSAADEVVSTPSGSAGSIGVFAVHTDYSRAAENEGIRFSVIKAGKYKAEGLPFQPLTDEARSAVQDRIDETYAMFVDAVARNRDVSAAAVRSGFGQGRALGAKGAVAAGMVDRVATLSEVLGAITGAKAVGRGSGRRAVTVSMPAALAAVADDDAPQAHAGSSDGDEAAPLEAALTLEDTAPQAEEIPVAEHTAAPNAGAQDGPSRERQLAELAHLVGQPQMATEWILSSKSVEEVRAEQLAARQANVRPVQITDVRDRAAERGFATFGEQVVAIVQAGKGVRRDPRLAHINALQMQAGSASGMNESVGSEGGFFIQPDLLPGVIDPVYTEDPILSRVTRIPIGANANGVKYNVIDETSRATGSRWGGIQMYWGGEADTATATKPKLRQMQLDVTKKLIGIAYLTDELAQDAPASEALLTRAFQSELSFMLGAAIFNGTGAGQPMGFLKSGALVAQAIEGSQTIANSATYLSLNLPKMLARIPASLWGEVIFLYNQELLPYLLNTVTGTNGVVPVFMAAGGLANRPFDTILGRPAFGSELCEAVGTPGDLIAIVPSQYHMADKGGPQQAMSMHVRFLYDENTLKITYRCDGAPVWRTTVTPYKGAASRSPFVTLAARS